MAALASVSFLKEDHEEDLSQAMPVLPVIFICTELYLQNKDCVVDITGGDTLSSPQPVCPWPRSSACGKH